MRLLPLALAAVVAASTPALAHHDNGKGRGHQGPKKPHPAAVDPCTGDPGQVRTISIGVKGQPAQALYAVPTGRPRGIVVFDHGYSHTMHSWSKHVARTAASLGVIAIAPDYRLQQNTPGSPLPTSRGWRVQEGAEDTIALAQHFERLCAPTGLNVVYGVSMGGNTSGLALAMQPKDPKGQPLFDYWVDVEGAANVIETYLGARSLSVSGNEFAANAQADIEQAFGGTLEEVPDVYADRTVVNRVDDIVASGVKGVVMVHGVADGLVTHDVSRQLQVRLHAEGVPVDMTSVVTRSESSEAGTTIDGYLPTGLDSPFAGHASEVSETHDVGRIGFEKLAALYGDGMECGERVVDGTSPVSSVYASVPC